MELLAAPVKRASEVDLVRGMKKIISSAYSSSDDPADYEEAIQELSKLRAAAITRCYDKVESSLQVLYQYHDQLVALDSKIVNSEVIIYFKWKDALSGGSWLSGRQSLSVASFGYERACVLFNIAALQSQIAAAQSLKDDSGLKQAARLMQMSANCFAQLVSEAAAAVADHQPTTDLQPEVLHALSRVMVAQAQEMFVLKAVCQQMKASVAARLSAQCAEYFGEAARALRESTRCAWDKEWVNVVSAKRHAYSGYAEFYQSEVCGAEKRFGVQIARLQQAEREMQTALSRVNDCDAWSALSARVKTALASALKDNNFIYHERVPEHATLEAIDKMPVAKISSLSASLSGDGVRDLFADLTPVAVQQAMASHEVRRAALVNNHVTRLRNATQTLNGVLASLNLPAALEDCSGSQLPASIQQKAAVIREAGGVSAVESLVNELPALLQRNTEILNETERLLDEERSSDKQMREQFKDKWTRTPSDKLTESFRTNCSKYRQIIDNAVQADRVVRDKFSGCRASLLLLGDSDSAIAAHLARSDRGGDPDSTTASVAAAKSSPSASNALHALMDRVVALKSQRDQLESQLKKTSVDVKAKFVRDSSASVDQLISTTYDPLVSRVDDSLQQQERLVAEIQQANDVFVRERGSSAVSARANELKQLASAHDVFVELRANLKEGSKFYNDLTQVLINFQSKVSDYCFARRTEKEELLKDLTSSLAKQNTAPTPAVPSHVQQAASAAASNPLAAGNASAPQLPYPLQTQMPQPFMPLPYYTPMPMSFNPYGTYPGASTVQQPQQQQYFCYPPAYPGYPAPQQQRPQGQ